MTQLVCFIVGVSLFWIASPSQADDTIVTPGHTTFIASGVEEAGSSSSTSESSAATGGQVQGSVQQAAGCVMGGDQTCAESAVCDNGEPMVYTWFQTVDGDRLNFDSNCPEEVGPAPQPELTAGMVAAAFRRLPLPASRLVVQPPNGRTLVNFETNFYTEQDEFTRTIRLLGRQVELRIWPERFGWEFGDGHEKWTTSPGDAYPHLEITHRYLEKGKVAPSVSTTYAAQFRVGSGPWRDVSGTVTIPGAAQSLRVVEARPVLVGGS